MATAFNQYFNAKAGLNFSKISGTEILDKMSPSFGVQAGVGVQFTKNVGLDLNYLHMTQTGNIDGSMVAMKESGVEVGLNGTF